MNYSDIIFYYTKGQFTISDNNLEYLIWLDEIIPKPTNEQIEKWKISYPHDIGLVNCKDEAKKRIASSDWSVLPDVKINNKSEFESYRSQLRNLILNPVEDPIFPTEPTPIWTILPNITGDNNG